jgi:hypothetical protein
MVLVTSRGDVTFSRNHETEADQIGLTLIAGYNQKKQLVSGLEWQQILRELHLSFSVHRQMHRELLV